VTDPLGLVGSGQPPASPVGPATGAGKLPAGGAPIDPNAPTFKDMLIGEIKRVNELQQDATQAIEDLQTGKRDDLETVLAATQKADMAFRMLLQVRNKVMEAYEEIKQIRV